jgi:hypothetical protein
MHGKYNWMKKKSKCASLALENGFGSAELHSLLWLVKAQQASSARAEKRVLYMMRLVLSVSIGLSY